MADTSLDVTDLQARLAALEAENRALRGRVEAGPPGDGTVPVQHPPVRRRRGLMAVAIILIVLGCLLAPPAVIGAWAKVSLNNTDRFVATYAPLAKDPQIQTYVVDQTMNAFNKNVDVNGLASDVIDGIKGLGTGPRANAALDALKGPVADGLQNLVRSGATRFVQSDAFATVWERALRISHTQLLATMQNDPNAVLVAQSNGSVGVQLGPIVAQIKTALVDRGISIASRIPDVNRTIPIAESSNLGTLQSGYRLIVGLGTWLPWISLLLLVAGVLIVRRTGVLIATGLAFAASMVVLLLGLEFVRTLLLTSVPPNVVPGSVTGLVYDTAVDSMRNTATAALVLGLVVALVAWYAGPFASSRRVRGFYTGVVGDLRGWAENRGVTTGRVGGWLFDQRLLVRIVVGVGFAVAIILLRPLTVSVVVVTSLIAIGVLLVLSLVERPSAARRPAPYDGRNRGQPWPTRP